MKGADVLFIPFLDILTIHNTAQKCTQKEKISSERDFPHGIIGIACAGLDTTFFQTTLIDLCSVTKTCLHINYDWEIHKGHLEVFDKYGFRYMFDISVFIALK
jgi:hypothetical protein